MKQTVNFHIFCDAFSNRRDNFSYEGLRLLFDYFEENEDERNEMELDAIAICCDYSEYTAKEIAEMYNVETEDSDTIEESVIGFLEDAGAYVGTTSSGTIVFFNQ
jgi:hypothetical protein